MVAGGVGDAGDHVRQVRRGQPFRGPALEDAVAPNPLASDHQHGAETFVPGARQEPLQHATRPILVEATQDKHDAFAAAAGALVKSGTSTLELALAGVPMVVTYRANPVSAAIARRLIKVKYAALVNLLAEREVVPEFLQDRCTPKLLEAALAQVLGDGETAAAQRMAFRDIAAGLAPDGMAPSHAAAQAVLGLIDAR